MEQPTRKGSFSSSGIFALCSKGRAKNSIGTPFYTYVEEKLFERLLNRPLNKEHSARPTSWGNLVEEYAFDKLGLEYSLVSKKRYAHKDFPEYWTGMPDLITDDLVGDIKCPYTIKSFCKLVKSMKLGVDELKKNHPDYYWQLVSNAILCDRDKAMLVVYVPYLEDLEEIRELARDYVNDSNEYAFINWALDEELPYILKDGYYSDINSIEFEVPQEDKDFLTSRVELAIDILKNELKQYL